MKNKEVYEYITELELYCQLCGSTWNLHRHHIIYGKLHGTRDELTYVGNIIVLCENCHLEVHKHKKKYIPILQEIDKKIRGVK